MKKLASTSLIKLSQLFILFAAILSLFRCSPGNSNKHSNNKTSENDPFINSIVKSEFFRISGNESNTVEGKNGTIITLPKGCFKNNKGQVVLEKIRVELAEASTLDDLVLSNLTTSSDGNLLQSKGMIYINATANGEELTINPDNPLYVEIPKDGTSKNMMVYTGVRDKDGKMNWINPQALPSYLTPVELSTLNFYPPGFENAVEAGIPFRKHNTASSELKDSLYYSLSQYISAGDSTASIRLEHSSLVKQPIFKLVQDRVSSANETESVCGIDPASIKVIKSKKFENTFISTREFEKRLEAIFKTCDNSILEIYIKNLDKDLWKLDEAAFQKLGPDHNMYNTFKAFSEEKLTNVKAADKRAVILKNYYDKQLKKVKAELLKLKKEAALQLQKDNEKAAKMRADYEALLEKRERYRMEKFGFEKKELGWINVAEQITLKDLETFELVVEVPNGKEFDRVYTYIVNPRIKSLFSMISNDKIIFDRGYDKDPNLLMWKDQSALAVVVSYKAEKTYIAKQEFNVRKSNHLVLTPILSSEKDVRKVLKSFKENTYSKVNSIDVDLKFHEAFSLEEKRQERLSKERLFIEKLRQIAFPCCDKELGQSIFIHNCSSCHAPFTTVVGPPLYGLEKKRSMNWIAKFIRNSAKLIKEEKDKDAIELYEKYNNTIMTSFPSLTDKEILAIFTYLNSLQEEGMSK